jgi:hypothetical protein
MALVAIKNFATSGAAGSGARPQDELRFHGPGILGRALLLVIIGGSVRCSMSTNIALVHEQIECRRRALVPRTAAIG